jgi:hypothetical protein
MILGQEAVTLRRFDTSSGRDSEGYLVGPSYADSSILMSFQPLDGTDLQKLPQGERQRESRKGYTATEIFTASQHSSNIADRVVVDGIVYEVYHVEHQRKIIPHYKVLMLRIQEADPGFGV